MGLFAWILVGGLNNLGFDIIPLIAGLGVGGLAVALAARSTVENIIGSLMIFWDGPYKVGQRIKVLGVSAPPILRTPESLAIMGPQAFGLDEPFVPLEDL